MEIVRFVPARKRRVMTALAATVSLLASVTACGSDEEGDGDGASGDLKTITFAMDYLPGPAHNGLAYAIQEGMFEERGIKVKLLPYTEAPPDALIASGTADLGINWGATYALSDFAQGMPVTAVFALYQHLPGSLAVVDDSVTRPAELAGKKLGTFGDPFDPLIVDTMIATDGGEGTVDPVVVGTSFYQALASNQVDSFVIYASDAYEFEKLSGKSPRTWDPTEYGVPDIYGNLMLANNDFLEEDPDLARDFLDVFTRAYEFSLTNPAEANDALEKQFPGKIDRDMVDYVSKIQSDWLFVDLEGGVGRQDLERWQETLDFLVENDQLVDVDGKPLPADFDLEEHVTNEYLPAA